MKLIHQCFFGACLALAALPAYSEQTLWYSGDTTAPSAFSSSGLEAAPDPFFRVYQDFVVPSPGWHITSVFGNHYFAPGALGNFANWEIRRNMPAGSGGALVAKGESAVTPVATGNTAQSGPITLTEYTIRAELSLDLPPGHYWLAVVPQSHFASAGPTIAPQTFGVNCIGTPCGNNGNAFYKFAPISGSVDFSMGVIGAVASRDVTPVLCQPNAFIAVLARAEGIAERTEDLLLSCSGGTPTPTGQPIPAVTFQVSLNTAVASRILDQSSKLSEATLMIDEPNAGSAAVPDQNVTVPPPNSPPQKLCPPSSAPCAETGTGGSPSPYQTQPNVFLGHQSASDTITWSNVPFDPPGPNLNRLIRISNLRANASQLPLSQTLIPTQITATVTADPSQITVMSGTQTVAFMQPALVDGGNTVNLPQCSSHNASLTGGTGTTAFDLSVTASEAFASSFSRRDTGLTFDGSTPPPLFAQNVPGFPYNTESGFYAPELFSSNPLAGLADYGTRIRIKFNNVGSGIHLFVPVNIVLTGLGGGTSSPFPPPSPVPAGLASGQLQLVQADQSGISASPGYTSVPAAKMVQGSPVAEVSYAGNSAYAIYEVVNSDLFTPEIATIPVAVAFNSSGNVPAVAAITINISPAPAADSTAPIPRFVDRSIARQAISIDACPGVPVSVTTNPPGLALIVDNTASTAPQSYSWVPGSTHTLAAPSPQGISGSREVFASWSDGLPASHSVTAPNSAVTYTASFTTQYEFTASVSPPGAGTVTPASGSFFAAGSVVPIQAFANPGFVFTGWTGPVVNGSITMTGPISMTANFAQSANVSLQPSSASFAYQQGASPSTLVQTIDITANIPLTFTVTSSASWLSGGQSSGTAPGSYAIVVNAATLAPGRYSGTLNFSFSDGSSAIASVTLSVVGTPELVATPASVSFTVDAGATTPQATDVDLGSKNLNVAFTAAASVSSPANGTWLQVKSTTANTPSSLHIVADPSGLQPGTYQGAVVATAPDAVNSPFTIAVTLIVNTPGGIYIGAVSEGASFIPGVLAPNTIVSAFGNYPGCDSTAQVLVDGTPTEVFSSSTRQINFLLPARVAGHATAAIQIKCGGIAGPVSQWPIAPLAPGIFTVALNGSGPASVVIQPTEQGTYVQAYVTGFGLFGAPGPDGLSHLLLPVSALIGDQPAKVDYAGQAPGFSAGLQQINVLIPDTIQHGTTVSFQVTVGGVATQAGVTLAIP